MKKFICMVCGFEYEGDALPVDYICPICGVDIEQFQEADE